jgi:hypothetical protein
METRTAFRGTVLSRSVAFVIIVLTALMLAAGAIAASGNVKNARAATIVELTYTVWFSPAMTGVVGGDFTGTFGGAVLSRTPIPNTPIAHLKVLYVISDANDPAHSFTAIVEGDHNKMTNSTVLNGVVTGGWLAGEQAHSQFQTISGCPGKPSGPCSQGTLRLM